MKFGLKIKSKNCMERNAKIFNKDVGVAKLGKSTKR